MLAPVIDIKIDETLHMPLYKKAVTEKDKEEYIKGS
jgi:hypothetical protein